MIDKKLKEYRKSTKCPFPIVKLISDGNVLYNSIKTNKLTFRIIDVLAQWIHYDYTNKRYIHLSNILSENANIDQFTDLITLEPIKPLKYAKDNPYLVYQKLYLIAIHNENSTPIYALMYARSKFLSILNRKLDKTNYITSYISLETISKEYSGRKYVIPTNIRCYNIDPEIYNLKYKENDNNALIKFHNWVGHVNGC